MGSFKMKIEKKIGKNSYEFIVEGENLHEAVMESKKLSFFDIHKCGCCGSDDLSLDAHVAKNKFKYTTIKCGNKDCRASVNFGTQTENKDIFYVRLRDKSDGTGKEIDWKRPENDSNAQATQQIAHQQVSNYTQQPNNGQPRQ